MQLRVQMLTPVSAKCSWNRRMSSNVAASTAAAALLAYSFRPLDLGSPRAWLALLAGVVLATKMYWVALAWTRRPRRTGN